ncbi:MAG TPA: alkaline phosphatase family protein [Candidatus Dormibacteraeota bacterium]|nr:alkaline phosphatase family protein [Candidatus Dormibacteraeota bacterium]
MRGLLVAGLVAAMLAGCGGGASGSSAAAPFLPPPPAKQGKHFTHIVILVQENRTFDNLFARFPGADGTTVGKTHNGTLRLRKANLESALSPSNGYPYWSEAWNNGRMNGFDLIPVGTVPGTYVYQYVDPAQIRPYWDLATQYVLGDHVFQTQGSGSFSAHQDLIRGGTGINSSESLIDYPNGRPWGCDAPAGTVTSLISTTNEYLQYRGPYPCMTYRTLRDLLDADGISWRYYAPEVGQSFAGDLWNAFDAISAVRHGPEWSTNQASPETKVFTDIDRDTLPAVSWVIPDYANSDHSGNSSDTGPSWVAQVVNAIGESPAWDSTAIIIVWDDWGGWYDHVRPPGMHRSGGLGFRVPLIAVSPYAKAGYVSHRQYELGSIVRFVEDNWNLGRLGTTDQTSADFIDDFFDFTQHRKFVPIKTEYSKSHFVHQRPSHHAVDDE